VPASSIDWAWGKPMRTLPCCPFLGHFVSGNVTKFDYSEQGDSAETVLTILHRAPFPSFLNASAGE
jgi:hypothetical protein